MAIKMHAIPIPLMINTNNKMILFSIFQIAIDYLLLFRQIYRPRSVVIKKS